MLCVCGIDLKIGKYDSKYVSFCFVLFSLFSIMFYVFSACLRIEMTTMAPHLVLAHKMTIIKKEEKAIKNSDDDGVWNNFWSLLAIDDADDPVFFWNLFLVGKRIEFSFSCLLVIQDSFISLKYSVCACKFGKDFCFPYCKQ